MSVSGLMRSVSRPLILGALCVILIVLCTVVAGLCQDKAGVPKEAAAKSPPDAEKRLQQKEKPSAQVEEKPPAILRAFEVTLPEKPAEEEKGPKLFGRNFFRVVPAEFEPSPDTPVPAEYALGPGDELEVIFSSETGEESTVQGKIDPQGQVRVPNVGMISARGLRLTEFESRLNRILEKKYPSLKARVTLQKLRAVQVFVAGEAERPGAYTLSGLSRVFNALYAAGGPSEVGSMRRIQLIRDNKGVAELDVYEYLLTGKRPGDIILQSDDTVFIPVIGPTVTVQGEVRRPAIYEMKGVETLGDAIRMAGGLSPSAYARRIQLDRVDAHEKRVLLDVQADNVTDGALPEFKTPLRSGDLITVLPVLEERANRVEIKGMVKRPGEYQWKEGMRVSELILAAEGLAEEEVYLQRANVYRLREDNSTEVLAFDLGKALGGNADEDIALMPKDQVVVYSLAEASFLDRTVKISGAVVKPGVHERKENMTLRDLVIAAGGVVPEAHDLVEIARMPAGSDKSAIRTVSLAKAMRSEQPDNVTLEDRDHVSIPTVRQTSRAPKTVTVAGEIAFPGTYALESDEEHLSHLIERAGGLTPDAFPEGAMFVRRLPFVLAESQTEIASNIEESMRTLAEQVYELELAKYGVTKQPKPLPAPPEAAKVTAATGSLAAVVSGVGKTQGAAPPTAIEARQVEEVTKTARLPIDLRSVLSAPNSESDLILQEGDYVSIPRRPVVVSVAGAVVSPSLVFHKAGQSIEYYVGQCGGYAKDANKPQAVVIRANGRILKRAEVKVVELGDIIVVPTKALATPRDKWEKWGQVATTVGSLAITFYVLGK